MDSICAGIVSYNPDIERLKLNISAICSQVPKVYVVDNGSTNISEISNLVESFSNVYLLINEDNAGIAKALNQLCEAASKDQYNWILTLDQDTVCPVNVIDHLSKYTDIEDAGIICPAVRYEGWETTETKSQASSDCEEVKACMTSGSLTRIEAWRKVNGFREDYFIDFVDNEFCMKLQLAQYRIIRVNTCSMSHQLGESGTFNFLGIIKIKYTRHAPWRYYYIVRNNRAFIEEYKTHLPITKEYLKLWYILGKGILFSKEKRTTMDYVILGYIHARKRKLGKLRMKNVP